MFNFLAGLLAELYKLWPSYGGSIILFTALIMLVLSPLSIKSTRSMIAMQRVGPEVKKLQQKHKGDREALNREMMAFYQEHNINPFSSCLPLLLQLPVFFVLYRVLLGLTQRIDPSDPTSLFNPRYLEGENTPLAVALRGTNKMVSFGMDLSQSAIAELRSEGLVVALPFIVLIVLVVITAVVQQRQVQGRNPAAAANPQQQMIAKIVPFIFVPISISLPAGVVIYFVVSNAVRIAQQALVTRLDFKDRPPLGGADGGSSKKPGKPGKPGSGDDSKAGGSKGPQAAKEGRSTARMRGTKKNPTPAKGTAKAAEKGGSNRSSANKGPAKGSASNGRGSNGRGQEKRGPSKGSPRGTGSKGSASSNGSGESNQGGGATVPAPRPRKRKRKRR